MRNLTTTDTIVATATPAADGAIGIVRLSGPAALPLLRQVFRSQAGTSPAWCSHQLYHGWIADPATGQRLDEVLAVHMAAPHTYTREDMVEVQGHGGSATLRLIVALCTRLGARPAERGEFTLRAFLNGRIDLAQAEAVASLVTARTPAGAQQALGQLDGRLSSEVEAVRALLFDPLARIEAVLGLCGGGCAVAPPSGVTGCPHRGRCPSPSDPRRRRAGAARPRGSAGGAGRPPERRQVELAQCAARSRPRHRDADFPALPAMS